VITRKKINKIDKNNNTNNNNNVWNFIIEIQCMWNVKAKVIPLIVQLEPFKNHSDNPCATYQESMKLRS